MKQIVALLAVCVLQLSPRVHIHVYLGLHPRVCIYGRAYIRASEGVTDGHVATCEAPCYLQAARVHLWPLLCTCGTHVRLCGRVYICV